MSLGKVKRQTVSHKNRKRAEADAASDAAAKALETEQALAKELEDRLKRNKNLILGVLALVVVAAGIYATKDSSTVKAQAESGKAFRRGALALQGSVVKDSAAGSEEGSTDPLAAPKFNTAAERLDTAEAHFNAVLKGDSEPSAALAQFGLAAVALQRGDGAAAGKYLDAFLALEKADTVFAQRARVMKAHAMEADGRGGEGAAALLTLAKGAHEELKRLAATSKANPSDSNDERLKRARNKAADLFIAAGSMYRRAKMPAEAIAALEQVTGDDELKQSNQRYEAEEGLNILGKKAG